MKPYTTKKLIDHIRFICTQDRHRLQLLLLIGNIITLTMTVILQTMVGPYWGFFALTTVAIQAVITLYLEVNLNQLDNDCNEQMIHSDADDYKKLEMLYRVYNNYQKTLMGKLRPVVNPWMLDIVSIRREWEVFRAHNSHGHTANSTHQSLNGVVKWIRDDFGNYTVTYNDIKLPNDWSGSVISEYTPNWLMIPSSRHSLISS